MKQRPRNLSANMRGEDVKVLQENLKRLGFSVTDREGYLGESTRAAVLALQKKHHLQTTGVVDRRTAELIDDAVNALARAPEALVVRGTVRSATGAPVAGVRVVALDRDMRGDPAPLGQAVTSGDGHYEISYTSLQLRRPEKQRADLIVRALGEGGRVLAASQVLFNARPAARVDLALPPDLQRSEYEGLLADLEPATMGVPLSELTDDDLGFVAGRAGTPRERIATLRQAARLAPQAGLPAEVLYGLGQLGVPIDSLPYLLRQGVPALRRTLERALAANLVPARFQADLDRICARLRSLAVERALGEPEAPDVANLGALLAGTSLSRRAQERLAGLAAEHEGTREEFWAQAAQLPGFRRGNAAEARLALQLGALAGYHVPLVRALQARRPTGAPPSARYLVEMDEEAWYHLLCETGVPAGVPGATKEARARAYATALHAQVEAAFPTAAIAAGIARTPDLPMHGELTAFFGSHPDFDLLADSVETEVGAKLAWPARRELKRIQRLARVQPRFRSVKALMDGGLRSAQQIAGMSEGAFVARFGAAMGDATAARVAYRTAAQRSGVVYQLRTHYGVEQDAVRPSAIPPARRPAPGTPKTPSNWEELFGAPDVCACEHCRSVLGPAAYLADLLQFVRRETSDGLDALFKPHRRPDLQGILLNCHNAETPLPYVDLVNEILEQAVAAPGPVEAHQTTWTRDELAANPEHVEPMGYPKLSQAVFPWTLPFDVEAAEARIYLGHLGTSRHEVMATFYKGPQALPLLDARVAAEYLRLTLKEWGILAGQPAIDPWQLWGLKEHDNDVREEGQTLHLGWLDVLSRPRLLLERAGITFDELQELLLTGFVNWHGNLHFVFGEECSLAKARINFADEPEAAARLCRFVRLQRALGWSTRELDAALTALHWPYQVAHVPLLTLSQLQRLRERLGLRVLELLALYTDLDRLPAPPAQGDGPAQVQATLFDAVFFSRQITRPDDPQHVKFVQALQAAATPGSQIKIVDYLPQVTAALGCSADDVNLLLQSPGASLGACQGQDVTLLTHANLSRLYRAIRLRRAAAIKTRELVALAGLTGQDPLVREQADWEAAPQRTMAFLDELDRVRESGFAPLELDWLLRHQAAAETREAQLRKDAAALQELRAGLQQIAAGQGLPADSTPEALEDLLRQKLSLILAPATVDLALRRMRGDPSLKPEEIAEFSAPAGEPAFLFAMLALGFPALPAAEDESAGALALRYAGILQQLLPYLRDLLSRTLVKQQAGQVLGLETALVEQLLDGWVEAAGLPAGRPAIAAFLADAFAGGAGPASLMQPGYPEQQAVAEMEAYRAAFQTLTRLRKVAAVLARLHIGYAEARYLFGSGDKGWLDLARLPVDESDDPSLYAGWRRLVDVCALHRRLGPAEPMVFDLFELAEANLGGPPLAQNPFAAALCARTGWRESDLGTLCSWFGYQLADFADERALLRLEACFKLSRQLGVTIAEPGNLSDWALPALKPGTAGSIKRAARAKYPDDAAWAAVARPLQNALRERKRTALAGYLCNRWGWTSDQLYSHFLIDPEMSACMLTSRIKQAISSVQLFVQRMFLHLEGVGFHHQEDAAAEWAWMKNYRIWEANRKVFLFPENWIEPELRDDKSPFFRELENELRQGEVTPDNVEKIYLNYLQKLETVSSLEVMAHYRDLLFNIPGIDPPAPELHVFGRTRTTPHVYYYRFRDDWGTWHPWEKMGLDIEADHLLPVVWNRRLYLFWPIFKEMTQKPSRKVPDAQGNEGVQEQKRLWTIQLAWSQRWQGGWTARRTSRELLMPMTEEAERGTIELPGGGLIFDPNDMGVFEDHWRPVRVVDQADMLALLAPEAANNSSLFSFATTLPRDPRAELTIDVFYPGLWLTYRPESLGPLQLPEGRGLLTLPHMAPQWELHFSDIPLYWGLTKAGRFTVHADHVTAAPAADAEHCGPLWRSADYPMQGMAVVGTGSPALSEVIKLWQLAEPQRFKITLPWNRTLDQGDWRHLGQLFVADSRRTLYLDVPYACSLINAGQPGAFPVRAFYHPYAGQFVAALQRGGVDGLLRPARSTELYRQRAVRSLFGAGGPLSDAASQLNTARPLSYPGPRPEVLHPREDITFEDQEAYALYNWELFFHIPLLLAQRLSQNQQFEAAMRWFHYVFDPLTPDPEDQWPWQRPWKLGRFADHGDSTRSLEELLALLSKESTGGSGTGGNPADWPDKRTPEAVLRERLEAQIARWRLDPFKPHLLARMRITPYMKTVVMKYLDNLIAWADQLFRRDTIESINEATQLYILATEILGPRPQQLPARSHAERTYAELADDLDEFSNALEDELPQAKAGCVLAAADHPAWVHAAGTHELVEMMAPLLLAAADGHGRVPSLASVINATRTVSAAEAAKRVRGGGELVLGGASIHAAMPLSPIKPVDVLPAPPPALTLPAPGLYFCIPQNETLLAYWGTVADRLFKIRHCMNIEGVVRELPLFEPPIEPGLLVKAAAAGVDFGTVLNDLSAPAPRYRFSVLAQKAGELCQEVKGLGAALLAALEKRDAEGLALLRSEQEVRLLEAVHGVKAQQVKEAEHTLEGLRRAREVVAVRQQFYESRIAAGLIGEERAEETKREEVRKKEAGAADSDEAASHWGWVPNVTVGVSFGTAAHVQGMASGSSVTCSPSASTQVGGMYGVHYHQSQAASKRSTALSLLREAEAAANRAQQARRLEEWQHQVALAKQEGQQIDKQVAAGEVRAQIAELELANHEQQTENARAVDEYLRGKYTNQELYDWMIGQIAGVYFQSYELAYDMAKRAERAYRFELGLDESSFIRFGYWDGLRKGLLAGEQLHHDLRRMEADYLERNRREYELTRHVSLALLDPVALVSLRRDGECFVELPEALFDLDCPGHYMRRIKSVGLSMPCVAGPYTSVNCTLTLLGSRVRSKGTAVGDYAGEGNYTASSGALQSIVTSSAQNDSGLFELNFRDERYLPFEGAGAISSWRIELPREFRQFDYDTIADVILHVRYTAREGGAALRAKALAALKAEGGPGLELAQKNPLLALLAGTQPGLLCLVSARHDLPSPWYRWVSGGGALSLELAREQFPYALQSDKLAITSVGLLMMLKEPAQGTQVDVTLASPEAAALPCALQALDAQDPRAFAGKIALGDAVPVGPGGAWTFKVTGGADPAAIDDLLLVCRYTA